MIALRVGEGGEVAQLGGDLRFRHYYFAARLLYAVQDGAQVRAAIEVDHGAGLGRGVAFALHDGSAHSALLVGDEEAHPEGPHGHFGHLVIKNGAVEFLRPLKVGHRDLEPADGVLSVFYRGVVGCGLGG